MTCAPTMRLAVHFDMASEMNAPPMPNTVANTSNGAMPPCPGRMPSSGMMMFSATLNTSSTARLVSTNKNTRFMGNPRSASAGIRNGDQDRGRGLRIQVRAVAPGALVPALATAQDFPNKPIRVIVPSPAGGPPDLVMRMLLPFYSQSLGQPLVLDNLITDIRPASRRRQVTKRVVTVTLVKSRLVY